MRWRQAIPEADGVSEHIRSLVVDAAGAIARAVGQSVATIPVLRKVRGVVMLASKTHDVKKPDAGIKKPDAGIKKPDADIKKPDAGFRRPGSSSFDRPGHPHPEPPHDDDGSDPGGAVDGG